jgi:hypothetical protein
MVVKRIVVASGEVASSEPCEDGTSASAAPKADVIREAHRVLRPCLPDVRLPVDLSKLRAMLDVQMFGRDRRELRDDAVRVARQIDLLRRPLAR